MANNTEHFKVSEFACKCGCRKSNTDQRVINMDETIRKALGVPVHVNSGCRCGTHNKAVGGAKSSKHMKVLAVDLLCSKGAGIVFETAKRLKTQGKLPINKFLCESLTKA